jgi:hypothetical protein
MSALYPGLAPRNTGQNSFIVKYSTRYDREMKGTSVMTHTATMTTENVYAEPADRERIEKVAAALEANGASMPSSRTTSTTPAGSSSSGFPKAPRSTKARP